jgi:hypothetical protein
MAFRVSAGTPGKLNVKVSLSRTQGVSSNTASVSNGVGLVTLSGSTGITFTGQARVVLSGNSRF